MSEKAKETEEDFSIDCPACEGGHIKIHKSIYKAIDGESLLLLRFECEKCGYSKNDVIPLETPMKSGILTLKIKNENDLKSKVYRAPSATIEIPELELEVEPGPSAELYITNIEGVLEKFLHASIILLNQTDEKSEFRETMEHLISDIKKAMNGQLEFTLKITDPQGGSYIIPDKETEYSFTPLSANEEKIE